MTSGINFRIIPPESFPPGDLRLSGLQLSPIPAPVTHHKSTIYIVDDKYAQFHNYHLFSRIFGKPENLLAGTAATSQLATVNSKDLDFPPASRYRGCFRCIDEKLATCTCEDNARKLLEGVPTCNICNCLLAFKGSDYCDRVTLEKRQGVFCTGCNTSHARMWFSPRQLEARCQCAGQWAHTAQCKLRDTPLQKCITWEFRVWMCAHRQFAWADQLLPYILNIEKANYANRPFKNGFTFLDCPQCLPGYDEPRVLRPGIRYAKEKDNDRHGRLELTWRLPLSAVQGTECDDMLCPHLTFSDGSCSIKNGLWEDAPKGLIRCRSCGFRCFWTRKRRGAETIIRGRFVLWSSRTPMKMAPRRLWPLVQKPPRSTDMLLRQNLVCRNEEFHFPDRGSRTIQPGGQPAPAKSLLDRSQYTSRMVQVGDIQVYVFCTAYSSHPRVVRHG
ncbi:hypothetical protein CPLU01_12409 [Colletotrichum plurivorum]|uniref:Uncharacterized protein n=1 Tax=Colletotrichum plurivorum TaxID=2175906 RepID=A0A8H6JZR4_9PEZI|nr:hypothetical protein CPLU01_12409 [Colletotrichum plurivorum]